MIKVFVVEDSPTVRKRLISIFEESGDFQVVGTAATADAAINMIPGVEPDLVTLDVFLARGTAISVVQRLTTVYPVRVVLLSEAPRETAEVFEALSAGALELLKKPSNSDGRMASSLLNALRALSRAALPKARPVPEKAPALEPTHLVAIASSTGGPGALRELLDLLPRSFPFPIVVAQHLAEGFEEGFIRWLSADSRLQLSLLDSGGPLLPGTVTFARSGFDVMVTSPTEVTAVRAGDRGFHPSGDVLLESASRVFGNRVVGVVLSGIGSDGAQGARALVKAGSLVWAQSEASSIVYGMPKAAVECGAATYVGSPRELGAALLRLAMSGSPRG